MEGPPRLDSGESSPRHGSEEWGAGPRCRDFLPNASSVLSWCARQVGQGSEHRFPALPIPNKMARMVGPKRLLRQARVFETGEGTELETLDRRTYYPGEHAVQLVIVVWSCEEDDNIGEHQSDLLLQNREERVELRLDVRNWATVSCCGLRLVHPFEVAPHDATGVRY